MFCIDGQILVRVLGMVLWWLQLKQLSGFGKGDLKPAGKRELPQLSVDE